MSVDVDESKRREDFEAWVSEARSKGMKLGWAAYQYKDNYGEWPPKAWSVALGTMPERPASGAAPAKAQPSLWSGRGVCPTCGHDKSASAAPAPKKSASGEARGYPPPPMDDQLPF